MKKNILITATMVLCMCLVSCTTANNIPTETTVSTNTVTTVSEATIDTTSAATTEAFEEVTTVFAETVITLAETEIDAMIEAKLAEEESELLAKADFGVNNVVFAAFKFGSGIDFWQYKQDAFELALHMDGMPGGAYGVYEDNGQKFICIADMGIGWATPATVVTVLDNELVVLSNAFDVNESDYLYYSNDGSFIGMLLDSGVSAGGNVVVPYYWDNDTDSFKAYDFIEVTKEDVQALDVNNVVPDIDTAISFYKRGNGLIHVNYSDVTEATMGDTAIASMTFVIENNVLREYNIDTDNSYGVYFNALAIYE